MVQSPTTVLADAVAQALAAGMKPEDIRRMIDTAIKDAPPPPAVELGEEVLPLAQAAERLEINHQTARGWVKRGLLVPVSKTTVRGGETYCVRLADMQAVRDAPKSVGGRPRKE